MFNAVGVPCSMLCFLEINFVGVQLCFYSVFIWRQKAVLQASDTLLGLGKDDANDVRSLFRAGITRHTKSFQFLDVLCVAAPRFPLRLG